MAEPAYQRIGGRALGIRGSFSIWLGDGHIMQVAAAFGIERYRRWYLNEIQAIVIRRTSRRALWNLIWGILGGLAFTAVAGFIGLATASGKEPEAQKVLYVFAGIAGAFAMACTAIVVWNSLRGPTCTVFLQSPGGLDPLAAPARRRAADAMLARLRPLLEAAQAGSQTLNPT